METFFFGDDGLFGAYQPPDSTQMVQRKVLITNPTGQDYFRSHRLLQMLMRKLASAGMHVFRFDYRGCGDSPGEHTSMTLDRCLEDTFAAADEFEEIAGDGELTLLGLRVGANLALRASARLEPRRVVAWDPIVSGSDYLADLRHLNQAMRRDRSRFLAPRDGPADELAGFRYAPQAIDQLSAISLAEEFRTGRIRELGLLVSDEAERIETALSGASVEPEFVLQRRPDRWNRLGSLEMALNVSPEIDQLCQMMVR